MFQIVRPLTSVTACACSNLSRLPLRTLQSFLRDSGVSLSLFNKCKTPNFPDQIFTYLKSNELKNTKFGQFPQLIHIMEDFETSMARIKRPIDSPYPSPAKRTNFVGISPMKELTNVKTPTDRPFRVSIEGNIGAGKSTLIKYFENFEGIETYAEPLDWWRNVDGHNLLELLYTDTPEWLRVFQSYVQFTRLQIQTSKPTSSSTRVQMFERSIQNNRFCFMEQAYACKYLGDADYSVLDQWYKWIRDNVDINLDLIVYLRSTPEIVFERVKARARPEEFNLSFNYLKELHDSHEQWLMTDDPRFNTIPVLVLDADKTLEEIIEQYRSNEEKILGLDKKPVKNVTLEEKKKVSKNLVF